MSVRFRKSIGLGKGLRLNVGKRGLSLSNKLGPVTTTVGNRGVRRTVSVPGTGLSFSSSSSRKKRTGFSSGGSGNLAGSGCCLVSLTVQVAMALWYLIKLPFLLIAWLFHQLVRLGKYAFSTPNRKKVSLIIIGIVSTCCVGTFIAAAIYNSTPAGKAEATARALTQTAEIPILLASPTTVPTQPVSEPAVVPLDTPSPSVTPTPQSSPTLTLTFPAGFEPIVIPSQAYPKDEILISVRAAPGTVCTLTYVTPSGIESQAQGVGPTTANPEGKCVWYLNIGWNTNPGIGSLTISANGQTQQYPIEIK